ncbi:MAG TPA: dihydrofolate reductase family protein [Streptosporangiaceae bacterium]|jgi:dihydrofolate reductase|nr:dihydrofolate reductase family protein [Streptosporangiaceae bacterium]
MLIKARMGISADGYAGTEEGIPVFAVTPGFEPGASHGYPEFIKGCDAVVIGRRSFLPALGAPRWPWEGLQVYVLTSSPLPPGTPDDVVVGSDGPAALAEQLRSRPSGGDVHLVGGVRTIRAFHEVGALDRLGLVVLPILLGQGEPLSPPGAPAMPLRLLGSGQTFPDGSVELTYAPAG